MMRPFGFLPAVSTALWHQRWGTARTIERVRQTRLQKRPGSHQVETSQYAGPLEEIAVACGCNQSVQFEFEICERLADGPRFKVRQFVPLPAA